MSEIRTLCLTDVVDSTKLAETLGDERNGVLWAEHDRLARELVASCRGFELERTDVGRGGIVRDASLHQKAQRKVASFVETSGHEVIGLEPSLVAGTDGNQEFFLCARKRSG